MTRPGVWRFLTSLRATLALLVMLAVLLLLNIAIPQSSVIGDEAFDDLTADRPVASFFLVTLGFGRMSTSPVFLVVLAGFFINLTAVLVARWGPTWRRTLPKARSASGLTKWTATEEARTAPLPPGWTVQRVVDILSGFGYRVRRAGDRVVWGVRHRTAPLGFLAFHVSFFLLFVGGAMLYYTRFVASAVVTEGQEFAGQYSTILREPPFPRRPDLRFTLTDVRTAFDRGESVHLEAVFRFLEGGRPVERSSRVNHPARVGPTSILVQAAGVAPVLWVQDAEGFTVDRVAFAATTIGDAPSSVPVADGRFEVVALPLGSVEQFPSRADLDDLVMRYEIRSGDEVLWTGDLAPGGSVTWPGHRLVLEELRYWVGVQVVSERGGGPLIAGFVLGIVGLIWRLVLYRREIALSWDDTTLRLVGRGEYFSHRFESELDTLAQTLAAGDDESASAEETP